MIADFVEILDLADILDRDVSLVVEFLEFADQVDVGVLPIIRRVLEVSLVAQNNTLRRA